MPPKSAQQPKTFPAPPQRVDGSTDDEYASGDEALAESMPGPDEVTEDGSMKRDSAKNKATSKKVGGATWDRIIEAFGALQSRKGLSSQKLKSYICDKYGIDKGNARFASLFRRTLKAGVETNQLSRVDQTFKLIKAGSKKSSKSTAPAKKDGENAVKGASAAPRAPRAATAAASRQTSATRKPSKGSSSTATIRKSSMSPSRVPDHKGEKKTTAATSGRTAANKKSVKDESADKKGRVKKTITKKKDASGKKSVVASAAK